LIRNELAIGGVITTIDTLRFTPAGVPLLSFSLAHVSRQHEAGHERSVTLDLSVLVLGDLAREMAGLAQSTAIVVRGFLARRSLKSSSVVLHATAYKIELE
jgi:primosomal replication protein N